MSKPENERVAELRTQRKLALAACHATFLEARLIEAGNLKQLEIIHIASKQLQQ